MKNRETSMAWADQGRVALLRQLWADGLSCAQIALRLNRETPGRAVTRCGVIGKVHRLGLSGRDNPSKPSLTKRPASRLRQPTGAMVLPPLRGGSCTEKARAARVANAEARTNPPEHVVLAERLFAPTPERDPVPFGSPGCRWPVSGEGAEMMCCGAERVEATPARPNPAYCAEHALLAYQPAAAGKRSSAAELARSLRRYA